MRQSKTDVASMTRRSLWVELRTHLLHLASDESRYDGPHERQRRALRAYEVASEIHDRGEQMSLLGPSG